MIEMVFGILIGTLFGAAVVGIVLSGSNRERELEAYRKGYRGALDEIR